MEVSICLCDFLILPCAIVIVHVHGVPCLVLFVVGDELDPPLYLLWYIVLY
jgi:hypothetical protein